MFKILAYIKNDTIHYEINRTIDTSQFALNSNQNINNYDYYNSIMKTQSDVVLIDTKGLDGEYVLLNRLVATKKIIIYISDKMEFGYLYNLMQESNFYVLSSKNLASLNDVLYLIIRENTIVANLRQKLDKYKRKAEEDTLVHRAKVLLMREGLSEEEAYKTILDRAMQERKTKKDIAVDILSR